MRIIRNLPAVVALALFAGCSSAGDGGTQPGPVPAISLSLSAVAASVPQGAFTAVTGTLTRSGGFSGAVVLAVQGAPAGVTGSVSNEQNTAGVTTATVTLQVAGGVATGTYPLAIRATGTGVADATAAFTLTVTAGPGFTLVATPATLSVAQGASAAATMALTRTGGFSGAVTFTATSAPAGPTVVFAPASTTGTAATATVSAAQGLTPGNYAVTVTAAAAGQPGATAQVQVTVTATTGGGTGNVAVDFAACSTRPVWFAYQDGSGPWTVITPTAFRYTFAVAEAKASFAWVLQPSASISQVYVRHMTRAELTAAPIPNCTSIGLGTKVVNGTLAGMGSGDQAFLALGNGFGFASGNGPFSVTGVLAGAQDLIAWRHHPFVTNPDRGFVRRDVDAANGGSVGIVDFGGAESFVPAVAIVTVGGTVPAEAVVHGMAYWSTAACTLASLYQTSSGPQTGFPASGFPAALQRGGDHHQLTVTATTGLGAPITGYTASRSAAEFFHTLANRTVMLPTPIESVAITDAGAGYRRLTAVFPFASEYAAATFQYTSQGSNRVAVISATTGWIGGTTATLGLPEFSGLGGWDNAWGPPLAGTGTWSASASGSNFTGSTLCQENGRIASATRLGSY